MTKQNKELAAKIIDKAEVTHENERWQFDVRHLIGMIYAAQKLDTKKVEMPGGESYEERVLVKMTKAEAVKDATEQLAADLENEVVILSDSFAEDHL